MFLYVMFFYAFVLEMPSNSGVFEKVLCTDFIPRVTSSGIKAIFFRDEFNFFISKEIGILSDRKLLRLCLLKRMLIFHYC